MKFFREIELELYLKIIKKYKESDQYFLKIIKFLQKM